MQKLKNSEDGVYEVVPTATDGKAWIAGFGKFLWVTTDAGASYQTVNIPCTDRSFQLLCSPLSASEVMVGELYPHPYLSDYAMITTQSSGKNGEYYASVCAASLQCSYTGEALRYDKLWSGLDSG